MAHLGRSHSIVRMMTNTLSVGGGAASLRWLVQRTFGGSWVAVSPSLELRTVTLREMSLTKRGDR